MAQRNNIFFIIFSQILRSSVWKRPAIRHIAQFLSFKQSIYEAEETLCLIKSKIFDDRNTQTPQTLDRMSIKSMSVSFFSAVIWISAWQVNGCPSLTSNHVNTMQNNIGFASPVNEGRFIRGLLDSIALTNPFTNVGAPAHDVPASPCRCRKSILC